MCSLYNVFKNFKTHKKSKCINKENDSPCVVKKEHIGYKLFVQDKEYDGDIDGLAINVNGSNNNIYISDLEKGRRNPTILVLNKIAIALNTDLSNLFKGIQ